MTTMRGEALLREIPYASCYVYSPGAADGSARRLRTWIKRGDVDELVQRALALDVTVGQMPSLAAFFPAGALLVPVPGSKLSWGSGATAAGRLAVALLHRGLGVRIWSGLRRVKRVRKSATAPPGTRPTVWTHYDTMAVDATAVPPAAHVILVDDVVTKGRTLFAAALRLREVLPSADVRGFALLRTLGYGPDAGHPLVPCIGKIEWRSADARRAP
jgi:hypothetical protein